MKIINTIDSPIDYIIPSLVIIIIYLLYKYYKNLIGNVKERFTTIKNQSDTNDTNDSEYANPTSNDIILKTIYSNDNEPLPHKSNDNLNDGKNDETNELNKPDPNVIYKGWSPFVKKWPCSMNPTGTFTVCGQSSYEDFIPFE